MQQFTNKEHILNKIITKIKSKTWEDLHPKNGSNEVILQILQDNLSPFYKNVEDDEEFLSQAFDQKGLEAIREAENCLLIKKIEYNEDLCGFILTLNDFSDRIVQVQYKLNEDRLSADYHTYIAHIDYVNNYELNIDEEETKLIEEFIKHNEIIREQALELEAELENSKTY